MKFPEIATTKERNPLIPASWWIMNAPRPLYGTILLSTVATWTGEFIEGIHYAAVDPTDTEAPRWLEENRRLGAVLLRYVTQDEMGEWALARSLETGTAYEKLSPAQIRQAYMLKCGRKEVEIP